MNSRQALVLGASGLVGRQLLAQLLEGFRYDTITIVVRSSLGFKHPKLKEYVIDFAELSAHAEAFQVEDVFCCLGTTIKQAGSQEAFDLVDRVYPLEAGRLAKEAGVRRFLLITAMGADPSSRFFYNRVKGRVEQELKELHLPALHLFRPSLLLGERKQVRFGERAAAVLARALPFLWIGPLARYRPIPAATVAAAMRTAALSEREGTFIYESDALSRLAESKV